jgi:cbb3-type cytochrome oxidase cytochrome c subunit
MKTSQIAAAAVFAAAMVLTFAVMSACSRPTDGAGLFQAEGCVKCHVYRGTGSGIIDLSDVTSYREDEWIHNQIMDPKRNDPNSGMPSFGHLTEAEVSAIIQFLHSK